MCKYFIEVEKNGKPRIGSPVYGKKGKRKNLIEITEYIKPCEFSYDVTGYEKFYIRLDSEGKPVYGTVTNKLSKEGNFVDITGAYLNASCKCPKVLGLRTFTGNPTPSYPVGVFNVEGTFLGIADDQTEYITIWNSDTVNSAQGTIKAGSNEFTFISTPGVKADKVVGLRYWQITLDSGTSYLFLSPNTYVELPDGSVVKSDASPARLATQEFWLSNNETSPSAIAICEDPFRKVTVTAGVIRVFHNEEGSYVAMEVFGKWSNNTGNIPPTTKVISFYRYFENLVTNNIQPYNYLNYREATNNVELFQINGNDVVVNPEWINHMKKLKCYQIVDNSTVAINRHYVDYNFNALKFPNLKQLLMRAKTQMSAGTVTPEDLAKLPPLSWGFDVQGYQFNSSQDIDNIFIGLAQSLGKPYVPNTKLRVLDRQAFGRTSASDAAVAKLQSLGYVIF